MVTITYPQNPEFNTFFCWKTLENLSKKTQSHKMLKRANYWVMYASLRVLNGSIKNPPFKDISLEKKVFLFIIRDNSNLNGHRLQQLLSLFYSGSGILQEYR
jgi:hypothetical protein